MAKYSEEKTEEHKECVRALLFMNPDITIYEAKKQLYEKESLQLDKDYVAKLLKSIQQERADKKHFIIRTDLYTTLSRESDFAKKLLWEIASDKNKTGAERISAMREIRAWTNSILDKMIGSNLEALGDIPKGWQATFEDANTPNI